MAILNENDLTPNLVEILFTFWISKNSKHHSFTDSWDQFLSYFENFFPTLIFWSCHCFGGCFYCNLFRCVEIRFWMLCFHGFSGCRRLVENYTYLCTYLPVFVPLVFVIIVIASVINFISQVLFCSQAFSDFWLLFLRSWTDFD